MRSSIAIIVVGCSALAWSCKNNPADPAAGASAGEDATARIERLCTGMNRLSLAYVAGAMELDAGSLETPAERATLHEACRTLPLELVECANALALDDPKCDAALAKHLGMTDATPLGEGPAPRWALALPFEVYDLEPSADGQVALAGETTLAMVADGAIAWTAELENSSSRVGWWKDCVLAGVGGELRCYDRTGDVRWTTPIDEAKGTSWLSAIEPGPDGLVTVVTSRGAIVHIDGDRCATQAQGCMTSVGTVESLGGMQLTVLPSGAILGSDDDGVILVSAGGVLLSRREASYQASAPGNGVIVAGSDVLRAKSQCTPGADDCLERVTLQKDLELTAPAELEGVGTAFSDTYGVIHMVGSATWTVDAGNDSDLVGRGTTVYSVGHELGLGDALEAPPQLRAIDARTGQTRWLTRLGTERAGLLSGYIVAANDQSIFVATKSQLFSVPLGED